MPDAIDYRTPGPLTDLAGVPPVALERVPDTPVDICRPVPTLLIQPADARALDVPAGRLAENQLRPARRLLEALLALDPAPVTVARTPERRVVGTCRHYAVLACALLRYRGIAARARCGFATYFQPGRGLDHWVTEYWRERERRWVRLDPESLGGTTLAHPEQLRAEDFLTGGEAWRAHRAGRIDAATFGVYGTDNWGPAEIRGNALRDLAALNKVETLPWDEWGRMTASYRGETGADYDELLDAVAEVCGSDDSRAVADLYAMDELRVPDDLVALPAGSGQ